MTIKTKGSQIFSVPNTPEGNVFLAQCRNYLNKDKYSIRPLGRGTRKEAGNQASIPLAYAEWYAIYETKKEGVL